MGRMRKKLAESGMATPPPASPSQEPEPESEHKWRDIRVPETPLPGRKPRVRRSLEERANRAALQMLKQTEGALEGLREAVLAACGSDVTTGAGDTETLRVEIKKLKAALEK